MTHATRKRNVKKYGADPVDLHVGQRLRMRRAEAGISQEQLAKIAGVTFQQIQKYERAANRMSASRLFHLAHVLNVPVGWFYEDMGGDALNGNANTAPDNNDLYRRETQELIRSYYRLHDDTLRSRFQGLLRSIADAFEKKI